MTTVSQKRPGFTKASPKRPFCVTSPSEKVVKLFPRANTIIINNQLARKKSFTPFFDERSSQYAPLTEAEVKLFVVFLELSSNLHLQLFKKRYREMAFAKRNWAQNGLPNRPQYQDFADSVELSHQNPFGLANFLLQKLAFTT